MSAKLVMVQGTGSSVGKSVIAAGLCRIFRQDGLRVAPFKAQNMSNNSFVCADGGEIGRAQAVQAEAAGIEPAVEMNPVLLKPEGDGRSQVVVLGRPQGRLQAANFYERKEKLWSAVTSSINQLRAQFDVVVLEGAGSPVELNLKRGDIGNMRIALYAQAAVLLVGDIDKGGIFASLLGTLALLEPEERELVAGLIVNKFRGDMALFRDGIQILETRAGLPVLGVVPYRRFLIPEEDAVALEDAPGRAGPDAIDIAVIKLPHISNFDDFDPLAREDGVAVRYVAEASSLGRPDLVIIPGTKATIADLDFLRRSGLAQLITAHAELGGKLIGICGGYQMLGSEILDPDGIEADSERSPGLGLLKAVTVFGHEKSTSRVRARFRTGPGLLADLAGIEFEAYEIHMGRTDAEEAAVVEISRGGGPSAPDGAVNSAGTVIGTYLHGFFDDPRVRRALRTWLGGAAGRHGVHARDHRERQYDSLANLLRESLDLRSIQAAMGL